MAGYRVKCTLYSTDIQKGAVCLKVIRLRPFDSSDMRTVKMRMSVELLWNGTDWGMALTGEC
jgi:hypothetical protein